MQKHKYDIVFLHPPSVYDFRDKNFLFGPISDVIPSTSIFEMYPIGFTSMGEFIERHGYKTNIYNLAYMMAKDKNFDVEKFIENLKAKIYAIDLHWLPHCHGSIEIAKIVKKYHPESFVMFGGLSSSYYYKEIIKYPEIDIVVKGDSVEHIILQIVSLISQNKIEKIKSLSNTVLKYKDNIYDNPITYSPENLDDIELPSYGYAMRKAIQNFSIKYIAPYLDWIKYPVTAILVSRGCTQDCVICGGSKSAYQKICNRDKPAFRSPERLIKDIKEIISFSKAPIYILHDIRIGGMEYAKKFLKLLKELDIENEIVFELFFPTDENYINLISNSCQRFSIQFTLESADEKIRKINGKFACSNEKIKKTVKLIEKAGAKRIDIYYMVGLPGQDKESVYKLLEFSDELFSLINDKKTLNLYIAPLAPFLDPGCKAFENPELYGYKKICYTLEDHRRQLLKNNWMEILSYETNLLSRKDIVLLSYQLAKELNKIKRKWRRISEDEYGYLEKKIDLSLYYFENIEKNKENQQVLEKTISEMLVELNKDVLNTWEEMKWEKTHKFWFKPYGILKQIIKTLIK